jgi:hypothetical protein
MKLFYKLITAVVLLNSFTLFSQAVFTSQMSGNWNASATWTFTGTDADGIPDADDDVKIKAHAITITDNYSCNSLTAEPLSNNTVGLTSNTSQLLINATVLTISTGKILTITNDFSILPSASFSHVVVLNGAGSINTGSMSIGNDMTPVSLSRQTTFVCRNNANIQVNGDVNLYSNIQGGLNNRATFRHDSGTVTINGQLIMTQESNGTSTQYTSNVATRTGTVIFKNNDPFVFNMLGGTQLSQLVPVFTGCTVQYSPTSSGLEVYNTTYRDLKITSDFNVLSNGFTINSSGNLYLTKGNLDGSYTLSTGSTITRSGGTVSNSPTIIAGATYNLIYAQHTALIISGQELLNSSTQLEKLTLSSTNGVQVNTIVYPNQLIVTSAGSLSGTGNVRVKTLFDVTAAVSFNTGGIVTLVSNISNTARVAQLTLNPTISGNVNVERYLPNQGRKWRLLTAPVKGSANNSVYFNWQNNGTTISNYGTDIWGPGGDPISNGLRLINNSSHSLRKFNNTTGTWTSVTNTFNEPLYGSTVNNGFLIFATHPFGDATDGQGNVNPDFPQITTTLNASGNLITGNVVHSNISPTTYYLVGNPYASPIDFAAILNDASNSGISKKIWYIDPTLGSFGAYVTWDSVNGFSDTGSQRNPSTIMQSGEAFFIKANTTTSSLTIKETHKTSTNSNAVINRQLLVSTSERLRISLHKEENSTWNKKDAIVAGFYAGGNNIFDNEDVQKISNPSETLSFYTDLKSISSEHRALIQNNDYLTIRLTQSTAGSNYKLKLYTEDFTFSGQAFLQDLFLGTSSEITLDGSVYEYNFQVTNDALSTANRFKIVFQASPLDNEDFNVNVFRMYPNPTTTENGVFISFQNNNNEQFEYKIFNCLGQLIQSSTLNMNENIGTIKFENKLNNGVYYINIFDENHNLKFSKSLLIN